MLTVTPNLEQKRGFVDSGHFLLDADVFDAPRLVGERATSKSPRHFPVFFEPVRSKKGSPKCRCGAEGGGKVSPNRKVPSCRVSLRYLRTFHTQSTFGRCTYSTYSTHSTHSTRSTHSAAMRQLELKAVFKRC
jgi:hypothetical protein